MKKWEYRIVDSKDVRGGGVFKGKERTDVEAYLNEFGRDGWEIINLEGLRHLGRLLQKFRVAFIFEFLRKLWAAGFDDFTVREHVHNIGLNIIEQALVMRDHEE